MMNTGTHKAGQENVLMIIGAGLQAFRSPGFQHPDRPGLNAPSIYAMACRNLQNSIARY